MKINKNIHKTMCILMVPFLLVTCTANPIEILVDQRLDALPPIAIAPDANLTNGAKVTLGRNLFWDPILSGSRTVACATCHHPMKGYGDGRALSSGVGGTGLGENRIGGVQIKRNSPTILNTGFNGIKTNQDYYPSLAPMFFDNRVNSLEEQAKQPVISLEEMRGHGLDEDVALDSIVERIKKTEGYQNLFLKAFGENGINPTNIFKSIASFERTLVANNSRFDQYANGDNNAISLKELRGLELFIDNGCINCHNGPMFSDYILHALGVPDHPSLSKSDDGDGEYRFRTLTLRNLAFTAPYMHNGVHETLEEVLQFYEQLGENQSQNPNVSNNMLSTDLESLDMDDNDTDLIIAFLNTLNDENFDKTVPESVPSGLQVGGAIK